VFSQESGEEEAVVEKKDKGKGKKRGRPSARREAGSDDEEQPDTSAKGKKKAGKESLGEAVRAVLLFFTRLKSKIN
jgi:hypothetical protein